MYITIKKQKENRKPQPGGIFKNPRLDEKPSVWGRGSITGEEFEREPKEKYRITLNQSYRQDGKVLKNQWHVSTVSYWDIVDNHITSIEFEWLKPSWEFLTEHTAERLNRISPKATRAQIEWAYNMILTKMQPIQKAVIEDYQQSEEYKWLHVNVRIRIDQRARQEAKRQREWEQREREARERAEEARRTEERYRKYSGSRNNNAGCGPSDPLSGLSPEERELAKQIIKEGFRKTATKCHPDVGGDTDKMQSLNKVNELLQESVGTR